MVIEVKRDGERGQLAQTLEYAGWARNTNLTRQAIRRGTFQSVPDLKATIRTFIEGWLGRCEPFIWTKDAETILAKAKGKMTSSTQH